MLFLEGGYDLDGLADSTRASLAALVDVPFRPEPPTRGAPGSEVVDAARKLRTPWPGNKEQFWGHEPRTMRAS